MTLSRLTIALTALLTMFTAVPPLSEASAATTSDQGPGQALEIAPPVINIRANPGQTISTKISLRDVSSARLLVTNEINDFVAGEGEEGNPKILLEDSETTPYSMKDWIQPVSQLTLNPREVKEIPVTIKVPQNAAPGGYFAVIRFTGSAPDIDTTGVALSASLGSLIFVRVNGQAKEAMSIESFAATTMKNVEKGLFESAPIKFVERLRNSGNVFEQPSGQVTVRDMFGNTVARVNVNLPPRNVLPGSVRRFEQRLDSSVLGSTRLFGRYEATLNVKYGESGKTLTQKVTFWVIPYTLIALSIIGIIIAFFVLRTFVRRYNRAIIKRAQSAKRKK